MKRAIIYQIGRLDVGTFREVLFGIEERNYKTTLSSLAIKDHLLELGYSTELVLLYPVSLPFNQALFYNNSFKASCTEECFKALQQANENPDSYFKDPERLFKIHPHSKNSEDFLIIHSFGTYNTVKGQISLRAYYSDIVLRILVDMLRRYLSKPDTEKFIIDISSGHNVYVTALLEAARYLSVWLKLYGWAKEVPQVQMAITEPIIPGLEDAVHRIYFERLETKAMFSSPVKYSDIQNNKLSREIYPTKDMRDMKRKLQDILEAFVIVFSAIKNNTPLVIYQMGYHKKDKICEILKELLENTLRRLTERYTESPGLDKNIYIKAFLAIGFYVGLIRILNNKGVFKISEEGIELRALREAFREIYKLFRLSLNDTILGNEVDKIIKDVASTEEWEPLIKVIRYGDRKVTEPQKRNFFAHAGFEGNITECKVYKSNNLKEIYVRYSKNHFNKAMMWVKEALGEEQ